MSDRLLVSTKKGLFALARNSGGWRVESVSFLGENVTLAHADHEGGWFAALNLGHFGVKLKFSPDDGKTWEDRAAPAYPEGETFATGRRQAARARDAEADLGARVGRREPDRPAVGRNAAGRAVPLGRRRRSRGNWCAGLWDRPERGEVVRRRRGLPGHPLDLSRPAQSARRCGSRSRAAACGSPRTTARRGQHRPGALRRVHAAGRPVRQGRAGPAHDGAVPGRDPDHLWIQHHNGVFRSTDGGQDVRVDPERRAVGVRLRRRGPSERARRRRGSSRR